MKDIKAKPTPVLYSELEKAVTKDLETKIKKTSTILNQHKEYEKTNDLTLRLEISSFEMMLRQFQTEYKTLKQDPLNFLYNYYIK